RLAGDYRYRRPAYSRRGYFVGDSTQEERMRRMLWIGTVMVALGLWIWLSALGVPHMMFRRDWPILIIVLGGYIIFRRLRRWQQRRKSAAQVITDLEAGRIDVERALDEIRRSR
ncbi:MAG: hypothetical protein ABIK86_03505, partial [candidate division WOR-3 bacterium]